MFTFLKRKKEEKKRKLEEFEEAVKLNDAYPYYHFALEILLRILTKEEHLEKGSFHHYPFFDNAMLEVYWGGGTFFDLTLSIKHEKIINIEHRHYGFVVFETKMKINGKWVRIDLQESQTVQTIQQYIKNITRGKFIKSEIDSRLQVLKKEADKNKLRNQLR